MKKIIVLWTILISSSTLLLASCPGDGCRQRKIYNIGDTWEFDWCDVTLKEVNYAPLKNTRNLLLKLDYDLSFKKEVTNLDSKNIRVGNGNFIFKSLVERNKEENGYDIFARKISGDVSYAFYYSIPVFDIMNFYHKNEKNDKNLVNLPFTCRFYGAFYNITIKTRFSDSKKD